ncbi:MAG: Peptide deformylase [Chlamydiae bacterium]|nr:Peptide deformylase [Chlamydiota bacterium]
MKLPLAYYGDPMLRKKGVAVEVIDDEIRQLVRDMVDTMIEHNGIGLAAPQVHRSLDIFITAAPNKQPDGSWKPGELRVFINTKILFVSEEKESTSEGCLSIPTLYAEVVRPVKIRIHATDLDGNEFEEEFSGLEARDILHENDHVNGVLFVDRIQGKERKEIEPKLREIKKTYYQKK